MIYESGSSARTRRRGTSLLLALVISCIAFPATTPRTALAATLPGGFTESQIASGLASPTAMAFAPDGRIFVCQQGGSLRVIKNDALLATPFVTVTVNSSGERGLLGVAFDPDFANNSYVYVYYTATTPNVHNRISRFTASGDVAVAGSEVVVLDLPALSSATNHNGGAIHFGFDGKLYVAVGDNANGANSQSLSTVLGKILRINADGTIPVDNPFFTSTTGNNRAIWALGLRNPYTFEFQNDTGVMYINDVGQNAWEEINEGAAGANYGWPAVEGTTGTPPSGPGTYRAPVFFYGHGSSGTTGCAITGGSFYNPETAQFPSTYVGKYFFADFCSGWIRLLDPSNSTATSFATGIASPVDLKVSTDGALYYLARGSGGNTGTVTRITFGATPPGITTQPQSQTVAAGGSATFSVVATGAPPLSYQWQRNGTNITGATSSSYTLSPVQASDNGAQFRVVVTNPNGSVTSAVATLTVSSNTAPVPTIVQPAQGTLYNAGNTITYSGTASDQQDGTLPASAFTWQVDFHHDTHAHPFVAPTSGATGGSFTIPTTGETAANVWYRIYLTVRDSGGLTTTVFREIFPRTSQVTLATSPAGLQLRLDAQPVTAPTTFTGVVGITRAIEAVSPQTVGGVTYVFDSWSDGGAAAHSISTPASNTTYTAVFRVSGTGGNGLAATYYDNANFTGATVSRVDPTVGLDWGTGAPAPGIGADTFSVRWTGQVQAQFSQTYTFYTQSDDGVRLWVNGQPLVNNWTDHAVTENSGTIALVAGQRYNVTMEFYENGGFAVARLLWSSPSTPKAVVPTSQLFSTSGFTANVNFQPTASAVPAGYLRDDGSAFANRGNGFTYGWNGDNTANTRDRNLALSPDQRYDTLNHMQKPTLPTAVWEIAVPNGTYRVRVVSGDPGYFDSVFRVTVEGVLTVSGTPTTSTRWIEGTQTVTVADGRLTLANGAGASNNKVCFVEITQQ
jgi:glucose/arabinose dehydrogenase